MKNCAIDIATNVREGCAHVAIAKTSRTDAIAISVKKVSMVMPLDPKIAVRDAHAHR